MDKKTKIFFLVFFLLIAAVVIITFMKYFVAKDYYITAQADCDPITEACFVYTCDPEVDGECPEDEAEWTSYYKNVTKRANLIPLCDPNDEDCHALDCIKGQDCTVEFCDESNVPEGEECNDPATYLEENPPVDEESEACAPDDEECLNSAEAEEACAPEDEECLTAQEESDETCSPDDENCASENTDASSDNSGEPEIEAPIPSDADTSN